MIPNGVDTALFRPDAARREHIAGLLGLEAEFAWLAAGRLMWKKGLRDDAARLRRAGGAASC